MRIRSVLRALAARLPPSATLDNSLHDTPERHRLRIGLLVVYVLAASAYFIWRLTVFNPAAPVFSAVFYIAELMSGIIGFLASFETLIRPARVSTRAKPGLSVDVFVTTYKEPVKVIRRTVLAAVKIRYPHKTWVLDDGNRPEIKAIADEFGCHYLAREHNIGAKAGNLNNALLHAKADFVACFDADHAAQPDFLDRLLGYFTDPKIAFVQTPQDFFNVDSFQHGQKKTAKRITHDVSRFNYSAQRGREYWSAPLFCGCSAVVRRCALDEIGGFPTDTVTEDMHASVRFLKHGYKGLYHAEPLAFGIAPVSYTDFLRQRLRWGEGNMDVCRIEHLPFSRSLTLAQNFCFSTSTWFHLIAWQRLAFYCAPIVLLVFQIAPISSDPSSFAYFFVPFIVATILLAAEFGRGYGGIVRASIDGMAQFGAGLYASTSIFPRKKKFRVTTKILAGDRAVLPVLPVLIVFIASVGSVVYATMLYVLDLPAGLPLWLTVFVGSLALLNAAIAAAVIANVIRVSKLKDEEYRHTIPLVLRARNKGAPALGQVEELSAAEVVFTAPGLVHAHAGSSLEIEMFLPGFTETVGARIEDAKPALDGSAGRVVARFMWNNIQARDRLDQCLHAGRWFRPIYGYHEACRTPYDAFRDLLDTGSLRGPERPRWRPAVYRRGTSGRLRLCYLTDNINGRNGGHGIIVFEKLPPGSPISVCEPDPSIPACRQYRIGERHPDAMQDHNALDCVGGRVFGISRQPCVARR